MKTPLFLTFAFLTLPLTVQARDLFNAPVHLGNGNTNNNGQAVHGSVPHSTSTAIKKPKTTTVPYDAEQMPDTPKEPTSVTTKQGTTVTTEAYAPPPELATEVAPVTPSVPPAPVATEPSTPSVTTPAPTIVVTDSMPTTTQPTTTITEPTPVAPVAIERAAPPPAVQLPVDSTLATEPAKTTADNSGYADKMFDAIKSMLGQKTQPIDDSLIRDEK